MTTSPAPNQDRTPVIVPPTTTTTTNTSVRACVCVRALGRGGKRCCAEAATPRHAPRTHDAVIVVQNTRSQSHTQWHVADDACEKQKDACEDDKVCAALHAAVLKLMKPGHGGDQGGGKGNSILLIACLFACLLAVHTLAITAGYFPINKTIVGMRVCVRAAAYLTKQ